MLTVCYVPGYTGASIPTQWAVLSIFLPLSVWRVSSYNLGHTLLFILVLYAGLTGLWALNFYSWVFGTWVAVLWLLAYHWGTLLEDTRPLWRGIAVGLGLNTLVALAQSEGYAPVEVSVLQNAGLFFNSSLFGVILGLTLVALICHKLWWYTPPLAFGLILSGSRGGILICAYGATCRYLGALPTTILLALGACAFFLLPLDLSDIDRLRTWGVVLPTLNIPGHGAGSFIDLYYVHNTKVILLNPGFAHNDILQLIYEYGLFAALPITVFALALANPSAERPILLAFSVLALFYFPLFAPLTAFLGFVLAGHALRDWAVVRHNLHRWRSLLLPRIAPQRSLHDLHRREAIPLVPRTTP